MPRYATPLTAAKVRSAEPGRYCDGDVRGLYLLVRLVRAKNSSPLDPVKKSRFWLLRYTLNGKMREAGLGPAQGPDAVSLKGARDKARKLRDMVTEGRDPLAEREAEARQRKLSQALASASVITFKTCSEKYITAHEAEWRNSKHRQQWENTLREYAFPHMGDLPVAEVDTEHVRAALDPIWIKKPETASRLRGRIEAVLDYAKSSNWRDGDNPARWRGHLENLLAKPSKVKRVQHHPALPHAGIGPFMAELRRQNGVAPRALEFTILTATRTNEVLGATWEEVDLLRGLWTIPKERMKADKEHRVPLSSRALAILRDMKYLDPTSDETNCGYIFPGQREGKPLSNMAMTKVLCRMGLVDITVHGFRSSFRDWTAERTNIPREVAEQALAHSLPDKVEAAYRRSDLFEKRRRLMESWAKFCAPRSTVNNVVPMQSAQ